MNVFGNLTEVQGVTGYTVFDSQGSCLEYQMPKPYELMLIAQVFEELRSAIDPLRSINDGRFNAFVARFENGNLVLRALAKHSVLLLTATSVNMAMLNVAFNVASIKLERAGDSFGKSVPIHAGAAALTPLLSNVEPQSGSLSHSDGSFNLSNPLSTRSIPADAVSMETMNALWKLLAVHVGPAAKFVLKQQLKDMGLNAQAVSRAQFQELVTLMSPKIGDPGARNAFISAARNLPR